jgi:hypothetical protein
LSARDVEQEPVRRRKSRQEARRDGHEPVDFKMRRMLRRGTATERRRAPDLRRRVAFQWRSRGAAKYCKSLCAILRQDGNNTSHRKPWRPCSLAYDSGYQTRSFREVVTRRVSEGERRASHDCRRIAHDYLARGVGPWDSTYAQKPRTGDIVHTYYFRRSESQVKFAAYSGMPHLRGCRALVSGPVAGATG